MSLIHRIYSGVLPLSWRMGIGKLPLSALAKRAEIAYMRFCAGSSRAHEKRKARLRDLLAENRPIRVAFQLDTMGKWKADSLLHLMAEHPRFSPVVWFLDYRYDAEKQAQLVEDFFSASGIPVVRYRTPEDFPPSQTPDIVFLNEVYDWKDFYAGYNRGAERRLLCHIPYGFFTVNGGENYNQGLQNLTLYNFYENEVSLSHAKQLMTNRACNVRVTGQPLADSFLTPQKPFPPVWKDCGPGMKRVIWAPHWTIRPNANAGDWFRSGTFLRNGEAMLELAKEHVHDIQFAFKPHPCLYRELCKDPEWGKEKTDDFYRQWAEMPNTQLEQGYYTALFMQSDAMVHDCGSFNQEYLFADKPCMFLREGSGYGRYSDMVLAAQKCYSFGLVKEDIESFLQSVLRGVDDKAKLRAEFRQKYLVPPHGKTAAQNIIDCLLAAR